MQLIGITPFEQPDAALAEALLRAGALGVLDLGHDPASSSEALATLARRTTSFGVRISDHGAFDPRQLPASATTIVVDNTAAVAAFAPRRVLVQVTSLAEATAAAAAGADGLIIKGNESGGRVGEETAFVLLQRVVAELPDTKLWVQGGVGLHTAAACIAGGAHGVVLDSQLALLAESSLPRAIKDVIAAFDGSETIVDRDHRRHARLELPAGQDAAFAKPLAARFETTGRLVRGMLRAIDGHLRQARSLRPLAEGSSFAQSHRLRYPIVQGPMTRVSDRPAFAAAVANAGGLPFIALSLMRAAEARDLLAETGSQLSGQTWGVGILGFVPPELREEQLAVLRELKPPVALIAGGRPAQAAALEEAGIATYLHTPSPGLLDQFLKDGARRFVLEGRECGGHVGPRSSFVLWESAIERLLAESPLHNISVLFAGGIHDARSAAMVAALAAPLAARGAKIGVLVGTAYLFTDEAVSTGAIQPGYQREALSCVGTVLLDTAPGHSTRCIDSDYAAAFRAERARLEREAVDPRAMWETLEQLNLGRLRIAAKGLLREGAELRVIDADRQRREGMFMIGQVGALRHDTCSIATLHEDISTGSVRAFADLHVARTTGKPVDVAIIGMAAIFPDAPDIASFWANIVSGHNSITEVPRDRWNTAVYYDPQGTGDKTPSKWGAFLPEIPFDPAAYGIPPRSLAAIEPVQLLALEAARRALDDAGYADRPFDRERTSVIIGAEAGTDLSGAYGFRAQHPQFLGPLPKSLDEKLPRLTEDSFPGVLANVIAGRIANRLDLGGVNYTVDAACASSLAAVDAACKELVSGTSELVLCGGADLHNSINDFLMFASVHALSPTGQCRPFDASADGIALGEGVGMIVLKRLTDAERDGDRIYAVIKGIGGSSDGKSLGLTAPRKDGQIRALERAYERAGISPSEIELVEAHGTGTVVGDRTELATLAEIWESSGALTGTVTLGSVKSQIGHTKCAAGMAGLIKSALAVHHGALPPATNLKQTNPAYDAGSSPFVFRGAATPWLSTKRRAGVSAFGFGGTNFHVVLESVGEPKIALDEWSHELVVVRGTDRQNAEINRERLLRLAERGHRLRDIARSAAAAPGEVWLAVVADSTADLDSKLRVTLAEPAAAADVAFLFPGQGSQRPGMLAELFISFSQLAPLRQRSRAWADRLFPGVAFTHQQRSAQQSAITDTRVAQPVLGICDVAIARLLESLGVGAAMVGGHSYGELVALTVAGAIAEHDLLALSEARALAILDAAAGAPGTMAAVAASVEQVAGLVGADVAIANHNAPDQTVIAGSEDAIEQALACLTAAGLSTKRLPVACAFHSPVVAAAARTFGCRLAQVQIAAPRLPVYSNTTAEPYPIDPCAVRERLAEQIARPVRFAEEIEGMYAAGARIFVEVGPGAVLTDLVDRILRDRPHLAIACAPHGQPALSAFLRALAQLLAAGVHVDVSALFAGRDARLFDLAAPPSIAPPPTAWLVNGKTARPLSGELPEFAMKPILEPVQVLTPPTSGKNEREATVLEFLNAMHHVVETEKEVMLRFLGSGPASEQSIPRPLAAAAPAASEPAPISAPAPVAETRADPLNVLTAIVAERTGYPTDMLDPDLDLEADLGIDSIKRVEILGELSERYGLGTQNGRRSEIIETLATVKTMRGIAERLAANTASAAESPALAGVGESQTPRSAEPKGAATLSTARYRFAPTPLPTPVGNPATVRDRRYAIAPDDAGVGEELRRLLCEHGARARLLTPDEPLGALDGFVHLESLSSQPALDPRRTLFVRAKEAVEAGVASLYAATAHGGTFGESPSSTALRPRGGIAGFVKSVAKEIPALRARVIDLEPNQPATVLAAALFAEMLTDDQHVEIGYVGERRQTRRIVQAEPNGTPDSSLTGAPMLGPDSVVLVTGGARGITAAVAVALAQRFRCRLELVGRSLISEPEAAELLACGDALALRRELVKTARNPATIEARVHAILAAREARATVASIERAGGRARYHVCDVRDAAAFGALIDDIYADCGRIDGAIHGAGVIEDTLLVNKSAESFDRVFETKVRSANTLVEKLRADVGFIVFFSSIAGAFGNRGQTDYAAANDALDTLALHQARRMPGRIVSIAWGPWAGAGMITPELQREYSRRGIGLIPLDEGVDRVFQELSQRDTAQVVVVHPSAAEMLSS